MGIKNKQRRAAKAKRRAKDHGARHHGGGQQRWSHRTDERSSRPLFTPAERIRGLLEMAAIFRARDERFVAEATAVLASSDERVVDRESQLALLSRVDLLWRNGWQPSELIRHARRHDARAGRLVATAVAADHAQRDPRTLHPRWSAQIDALELPAAGAPSAWLTGFARSQALDRLALIATLIAALRTLYAVGPLQTIIPPPGAAGRTNDGDTHAGVDDPVLVRVRALLAQAESTTFEAEAEAFTAKAQELMARHAIDTAMLWAQSARDERPTSIRLPIDDPYADIKSVLLSLVARHSRCKAVFHPSYALSTVVGFRSDVAATEMLFTSLLVQAQSALQSEAAKTGPGGRARSRPFRSSFLLAFTHRIDQRLAEINKTVTATVTSERNDSFLPVLVARDQVVDDMVAELFGELQSSTVSGGSDAAGWSRGTMAADLAQLNFGDLEGSFIGH